MLGKNKQNILFLKDKKVKSEPKTFLIMFFN